MALMLTLSAPEMTVLVAGLRVLGVHAEPAMHGVFTERRETLSTDFLVHLLDMRTQWQPAPGVPGVYEGRDRSTQALKWTATRADLVFGSHAQLRAIAEVYASSDAPKKFVADFVAAWDSVMNLGRFDLV